MLDDPRATIMSMGTISAVGHASAGAMPVRDALGDSHA
jgi:hypothetical protein